MDDLGHGCVGGVSYTMWDIMPMDATGQCLLVTQHLRPEDTGR